MKASIKKIDDHTWVLDGGRLSFPNLWEPGLYEGARKTGLDSSLIISKDQTALIKEIKMAYLKMGNAVNSKIKKLGMLKNCKLKMTSEGDLVIQTNNTMEYPPVYMNLKGDREDPIAAGAKHELYAGCYVKTRLSFNPTQDGDKVKIWIGIDVIQFSANGEKLGSGGVTDEELKEDFGAVKGSSMGEDDFDNDTDDGDLEIDDDGDDLEIDDDDDLEL